MKTIITNLKELKRYRDMENIEITNEKFTTGIDGEIVMIIEWNYIEEEG